MNRIVEMLLAYMLSSQSIFTIIILDKVSKANKYCEYIQSLHERYGDVIKLQVGALPLIFIGNGQLLKKVFGSHSFDKKPVELLPILNIMSNGQPRGLNFLDFANAVVNIFL